jgi:polyisoprenoid-binding protein YceI
MKKNMKWLKYFLLTTIVNLQVNASTPVKNTLALSKDYLVTINGTSNLHKWDETVETVTGNGVVVWNSDGSFDLESLNLSMEVKSIKSDMGSIMNNNTYKALKADAHPEIIFTLKSPLKSIQVNSSDKTISAKGSLTIAGVTKLVDILVKINMQEGSKLEFQGAETIKMTDYGVAPPTALFGSLKTGNEVTINFKTNFSTANK